MPLSKKLQDKGMSKGLSGFLVVTGAVAIVIGILAILIPILVVQIYQLIQIGPEVINGLENNIMQLIEVGKIDIQSIQVVAMEILETIDRQDVGAFLSTIVEGLIHLYDLATSAIGVLIGFFMTYIIAVYIIGDLRSIVKRIVELISKDNYEQNKKATLAISKTLYHYLRGLFIVCSFIFVFYSIGLSIIDVPAAIVLAFIAAMFNVIPYLGPFLGGVPIFLLALSVDIKTALIALVLIIIVQITEAYILQPKIMSMNVKIHPATVVAGVLIFGALFGGLGVVFATPTLSIINVLLKEFKVGFHI
jgi:predicted PurR-regulated permease PerM